MGFSQIELLSTVHHKYLVSLLGYRCSHNQQILVYEYLGGGDLRQRLQGDCPNHQTRQKKSIHFHWIVTSKVDWCQSNVVVSWLLPAGNDAKENPLTWKQRTSIILQVAEGTPLRLFYKRWVNQDGNFGDEDNFCCISLESFPCIDDLVVMLWRAWISPW